MKTRDSQAFDLIPSPESMHSLFILESPHDDEMETKIPVSGKTGIRMSQKLIESDEPLGILLDAKDKRVKQFGVMNSIYFPINSDIGTDALKTIKNDCSFLHREKCYKHIDENLRGEKSLKARLQFRERILQYCSNSPELRTIVLCGKIAQGIFLHNFGGSFFQYGDTYKYVLAGRPIRVLLANHPSPKTGTPSWGFKAKRLYDDD